MIQALDDAVDNVQLLFTKTACCPNTAAAGRCACCTHQHTTPSTIKVTDIASHVSVIRKQTNRLTKRT